jgi:hypothetical protein
MLIPLLSLLWVGVPASNVLGQVSPSEPRSTGLNLTARIPSLEGDLQALAAKASAITEVRHSAEANIATAPIVTYRFDLPLGTLHACVARSHVLTWTPSGNPTTYYLRESAGNKQARANAASAAKLKARRRLLARWEEVKRLASLPDRELARLAQAGDRTAQGLRHPRVAASTRLTYQLPARALAALWSQGSTRVRVADLPETLQSLAEQVAPQVRIRTSTSTYLLRDTVRDEGSLELRVTGTIDRPNIQGTLHCGRGRTHQSEFSLLYPELGLRQPPDERRAELPKTRRRSDDPWLSARITLREPASRRGLAPGERPRSARPLATLLDELAAQAQLPVIADCAYQPKNEEWLKSQWWLAEDLVNTPLAEALDLLCADFESEWFFIKGAIVVRSKYWFLPVEQRGMSGKTVAAEQ